MICESDLVGQILLQGLNTSKTQFPCHLPGPSVKSAAKPEKTLTKPVKTSEIKKLVVPAKPEVKESKVPTKDVIKPRPVESKTTTKPTVSKSKVAWDVNKVLVPKTAVLEKRPSDILADDVRDEVAAKRQRLSQWLHDHVTQPTKKVSSGTKRKASLMDKSCKDHSAKKQKMAEAKPKTASSKPV